jgi:hypothetical protein
MEITVYNVETSLGGEHSDKRHLSKIEDVLQGDIPQVVF